MQADYAEARRHANNTISEANRHMRSGKITNPQHHEMLTRMVKDATNTLRNLDEMESKRPYSDTHIGYGADMRQYSTNNDMMNAVMDAISKILPHLSNEADNNYSDDAEARRGGARRRGRSGRFIRSDYEGYSDDNANYEQRMDDAVARTAANTAAAMSRSMADVYPSTPVMPRNDARGNARSDADYNARADAAYNARSNAEVNSRSDSESATSDRIGPAMR